MNIKSWPNNADGDVFRRLQSQGFNFTKPYAIDFNIDFDVWPPSSHVMMQIKKSFPDAKVYEEEGGASGYILFRVNAPLTYEFVVNTQAQATQLVSAYGGRCESWGVLH